MNLPVASNLFRIESSANNWLEGFRMSCSRRAAMVNKNRIKCLEQMRCKIDHDKWSQRTNERIKNAIDFVDNKLTTGNPNYRRILLACDTNGSFVGLQTYRSRGAA